MVILVADRTNKLAVARQSLKLRNKRIPALRIARDGNAVKIVFVAKLIIDQAIAKDTITILNHARIIGKRIGIAQAVQYDQGYRANTFDGLLRLHFERIGQAAPQRDAHDTHVDLLHQTARGRRRNYLIISGKQPQVRAKKQRRNRSLNRWNRSATRQPVLSWGRGRRWRYICLLSCYDTMDDDHASYHN